MNNGILLKVLTGAAALLYGTVCVMAAVSAKKARAKPLYPLIWLVAVSLNTAVFVINWVKNGFVPLVSMYQVLVLLSLCFGLAHLYILYIRKTDLAPYFAGGSCLVSIGTTFMNNGAAWHFPPSLNSPFFVPHIFCYMLSYTLAAVAFFLMLRDIRQKKEITDSLTCVQVLFPFMTAGLILGALWANEVWGAYWSWDLKECWSLFAWLCYTGALHFGKRDKYRTLTKLFVLAGFAGVIVTFFFVNMMNTTSLHSYTT